MPTSTNEYFEASKRNYAAYLESVRLSAFDMFKIKNKKQQITPYQKIIHNYFNIKQTDLQSTMANPTAADYAERGSISALFGMLIGGLFFAAQQRSSSMDFLGTKTAVQGGFSVAIGGTCSALMFEIWNKSAETPNHATLKDCEAAMQNAGFDDAHYAALSTQLVELFYFRECLLSDLRDHKNINFREECINEYCQTTIPMFNETDFDQAVDVFFIEQLNQLFQDAFKKIHELNARAIEKEKEASPFISWFAKHFESEENRQKFTEGMQIQFIDQCIDFLKKQMNQPSFLAKYVFFLDAGVGLLFGALSVGLAAVTTWYLSIFALISIAVAAATIAAIATHMIITQTDSLYFKRNKPDRERIQNIIDIMIIEQDLMTFLANTVVKTTRKDLKDLDHFDKASQPGLWNMLRLKASDNQHILLGSTDAWMREFASRYQESKLVAIDLSEQIKLLINGSEQQTLSLQKKLVKYVNTKRPDLKYLTSFIDDTQHYLQDKNHAKFIQTFELIPKIKEQILDVVSTISSGKRDLPPVLVNFYTNPIDRGGLGGCKEDLEQARRFVKPSTDDPKISEPFYQSLIDTRNALHTQLINYANNQWVLIHDPDYQTWLNLSTNTSVNIEDSLLPENVVHYLTASFEFLYALNSYSPSLKWGEPFTNTSEFMLYRMLLIKQLANLADPRNLRIKNAIKETIKQFTQTYLNYNPTVAFDDIINQSIFKNPPAQEESIKDGDNVYSIWQLSHLIKAMRVDMAYVLSPLSPKQLIHQEATNSQLMGNDNQNVIFGVNHTPKQLSVELSMNFFDKLKKSIENTTEFFAIIQNKTLINLSGSHTLYRQIVANEIDVLEKKLSALHPSDTNPIDLEKKHGVEEALISLGNFKSQRQLPAPHPVVEMPPKAAASQTKNHLLGLFGQRQSHAGKEEPKKTFMSLFS